MWVTRGPKQNGTGCIHQRIEAWGYESAPPNNEQVEFSHTGNRPCHSGHAPAGRHKNQVLTGLVSAKTRQGQEGQGWSLVPFSPVAVEATRSRILKHLDTAAGWVRLESGSISVVYHVIKTKKTTLTRIEAGEKKKKQTSIWFRKSGIPRVSRCSLPTVVRVSLGQSWEWGTQSSTPMWVLGTQRLETSVGASQGACRQRLPTGTQGKR